MNDFDLKPLRIKSQGKTLSEKLLQRLCEETLLSMWCFANPFTIKKTKKELCDVLIVFKNHIFIFSDKQAEFQENESIEKAWNRWYRCTIHEAAKQLIGAERQIKKCPDNIFVDKDCSVRFPFKISVNENTQFHRIIVARGSKKACKSYYQDNHGSLMINTLIVGSKHFYKMAKDGTPEKESAIPFSVGFPIDRNTVFHIFDDFTTEIVLEEVNSLTDFADYLSEKEKVLETGNEMFAYGEEDILAHYLSTMEDDHHAILTEEEKRHKALCKFDVLWDRYAEDDQYKTKKASDEISFLMDSLIEKFYRNLVANKAEIRALDNFDKMNELFIPFAELRRIERRLIAQAILSGYAEASKKLHSEDPYKILTFTRTIDISTNKGKYCILVFANWPQGCSLEGYKEKRREILEFSIRLCKHRNPQAQQIIGLAFSNDRAKDSSEDMMVMNTKAWTEDNDKEMKHLLNHGVYNNLMRRGMSISSEEYSDAIKVEEIDFPWDK